MTHPSDETFLHEMAQKAECKLPGFFGEYLVVLTPKQRDRLVALARRAPALTWQPMETAPKDGTPVMLFGRSHGVEYWFAAHWMDCEDGSSGWIGSSFWAQPEGNWTTVMGENLQGWMPLPPAHPGARQVTAGQTALFFLLAFMVCVALIGDVKR